MKRITFFILCLLMPICLTAIPNGFRFRHFSVENGLSSNSVRSIMQDKYGFLWFGTDEGLNRYDGTTVKLYRLTPQEPDRYISFLYDLQDEIWIGTDGGLYRYDYETEAIVPFRFATANRVTIKTTVNHITEDKDNNLWFSTIGQGVFKYNRAKHILEQYEFKSANDLVASVFVDSENKIWAITNWGSTPVFKLNKADNKFEPFQLIYPAGKHSSNALAMLEDSEHTLWLGTWESGLQKIDKYSGQVTIYLHPAEGKGSMHIHSLMEYAPHELLIGSDDGLLLFNTLTGESQLFAEDETNPYSLSNRFVYPIVKDREGGVWVGTFYGGVNYISPNAGQFESYVHSRYTNSISGTVIGRFCEDKQGDVWIASDDGGLSSFSPKNRHFTHYLPNEHKNSLSYHNVHALCMDGDDLWIGTYTGGVNVLNTQTGKFRAYGCISEDTKTLDGTSSYAIFKDRDERIWVASMSGVNLYNRKENNFIRFKDFGSLTIDIDQDTKGNIWFSTQGKGLYKFNPDKQIWKSYYQNNGSGALLSDQVNCTLIDTRGEMWVGTMNGLCKYHADSDSFESIPLDIPSRNICGIVEDQHILWLATSKGLVRYAPGEGCQVFTKSDGLQSDQFLPNASLKTSDGKIYLGAVNGFNAFYPYQIKSNKVLPTVVITGLEIYNKEIQVGSKKLPKPLHRMKELELSYKDNVFSLRYASLSYCTPSKNQYAYKLEGFDKDWNAVGSQHKATYTNLPAGKYVFRVKGTNNDGIWNEQGTSLNIIIHPPFYLSASFKVLYFILTGVVLGFLVHFIVKRTEKKHAVEIHKLNATKEKEVHAAKIKFFTMIAHEIRTPVSLIIGPLEKIANSSIPLPSGVRDDLSVIDRNSQRLLSLVNQLLDFRKVEEEGMHMKFAMQNVYQLLKAICERFEPYIVHHGAHLKVEYPAPNFTAIIDSEAVTKMISNLLTNASKYTKDEVLLSCTVCPEQHTFVIRVVDNGIGICEKEQKKIFQPFYQAVDDKQGTGIGLSIVKSIVESHKGYIDIESKVGKGSTFIVTLPVEQDVFATDGGEEVESPSIPEDILGEPLLPVSVSNRPVMLIVDDNTEMLNFLSGSFADKYSIFTAEDGLEALERLKKNDVTLIVSDWMMPRMDGAELCRAVRSDQSTSHIPFILLTAKTDMHSKIEGMDCGADVYIEKPFSVHYLEVCIKNLVALRSLLRQKFSNMPLVPLHSIACNTMDEDFLTRMNEIIEENFPNPELSVDFLAEELCISRSGLFAKIKTLANITPNELIQVVRLKKAAILLAENKYRINEICYMVGFSNPSYFSKCFQKQFGIKPCEFIGVKKAE